MPTDENKEIVRHWIEAWNTGDPRLFRETAASDLTLQSQWTDHPREPTMRCMHCNGQMERSTAPFHVDRHGYHLLLSTVPAWVCTQCGAAHL